MVLGMELSVITFTTNEGFPHNTALMREFLIRCRKQIYVGTTIVVTESPPSAVQVSAR